MHNTQSNAGVQAPKTPLRVVDADYYRTPPDDYRAEHELLGTILVNNESFGCVSDFLLPEHFAEPLHQRIYEIASGLIRAGKVASPVTITPLVPEQVIGQGINISLYLARLASEATTINAEEYGRMVQNLSIRRDLAGIGQRGPANTKRFPVVSIRDIEIGQEPQFLIGSLLASTGLAVVFGLPKCGKSFLVADAMFHVALGRQWAGCDVDAGAVAYVSSEGVSGLRRRFVAMRQHYGVEGQDVAFGFVSVMPNLGTMDGDAQADRLDPPVGGAVRCSTASGCHRHASARHEGRRREQGRRYEHPGRKC
jgi:hypothetical protein